MIKKQLTIGFQSYASIDELSDSDAKLVNEARLACKGSYAPYSQFNVGAAALLENQEIISGSNQENAAYPSGLCAERTTLFYANSKYPDQPVNTLAISAEKDGVRVPDPIKPCGACRQVIAETQDRFKQPMRIIMDGTDEIIILDGVDALLPFRFTASDIE